MWFLQPILHIRRSGMGKRKLWMVMLVALLATACTATKNVRQVTELSHVGAQARILLMQPDIKMYVLTAGGVPEPQPDWTEAARRNFVDATRNYSAGHDMDLTAMDASAPPDTETIRYQRLYTAVAETILTHHLGSVQLPTKGETFDWSLGPGVATLAERYRADYGLFVAYRDYSGSGGRWAYALVGALFGIGVPTGGQFGYAGLVDLRSGDVVWFNQVNAADVGGGDLRDPDSARTVVAHILDAMPRG
jgi:hypothetical protein